MSRVGSRVEGLEARRAKRSPPPKTSPELALSTSLLLKAQDAARRELDGQEPDPANDLTDSEKEFDQRSKERFLRYLEGELSRAPPGTPERDAITAAIDMTRADLEAEETDREES